MREEEAVNVFLELTKAKPDWQLMKPADLGAIRFAGPPAVAFMAKHIKRLEQRGLGKQREEAIADGQNMAEMIVLNEQEIGRRYSELPADQGEVVKAGRNLITVVPKSTPEMGTKASFRQTVKIGEREAQKAAQLAKHPEIVKEVLAKAKKEKELPTRERIHRAIQDKRDKENTAVAKRELEHLTEGQEMRMIATLGKMLLMAHKLQPFLLMSPRGRKECSSLAEKIKQELDTKIETAEAVWEEKHG